MRYASAASFRAALEARLRADAANADHASLVRLRKLVAFDRLLARLMLVSPERWVVKGGVALEYRFGAHSRFTRDIDFARLGEEHGATEDLIAAQAIELGDFFTFTIRKTSDSPALQEDASVRYHAQAALDGRRFEDVIIDVGFDWTPDVVPDRLSGTDLLTFADIPPVVAPVLPLGQHVAEKLHAYTRIYGQDRVSTRVKDLVDLVIIQSFASPNAGAMSEAIEQTFRSRATHPVPHRLRVPPTVWRVAYRRLAGSAGIPLDLSIGHQRVAAMLDPILRSEVDVGSNWHPETQRWLPAPPRS